MTWQRPTYKTIDVTVTVQAEGGYDAPIVQINVTNAINSFFDSLAIGESVTFSDLTRAILNAEGVDDMSSLSATDGTTTIDAFGEAIVIAETEKAKAGTLNVTVS